MVGNAKDKERKYLVQGVKDFIEESQYLSLGNLGDVVHGFTGIVTYSSILIGKASQDWRYNIIQERNYILCEVRFVGNLTEPKAMAAAAKPIRPPFREFGCKE